MPRRGGWRHPRLACSECGHRWPAPARFCGRCGASLRSYPTLTRSASSGPRSGPGQPTGAQAEPRVGAVRQAVGGVAVVLAVALVAALVAEASPEPATPDAPVDLADLVPEGRGPTGEEAARALAPFGPDRLSCRPAGCERWWHHGRVAPVSPAQLGDDLVIAFDDRVAAIDATTGAQRWAVPLDEIQPDPATGWRLRAAELTLAASEPDVLVWAPRGFVQVRTADGDERWSLTLPDTRRLWTVQLADDVVLVVGSTNTAGGAIEVASAYDRRHGTVRWRQRIRWSYATGPDGVLVRDRDDRVALLDASTGSPSFHLEVDDPRWVTFAGGLILAREGARDTVLFDRATGDVVRRVTDVADHTDLRHADGTVALLIAGRDDGTADARPASLEVVGPDGGTRWVRPVGCCARLVTAPPGTVSVRIAGDEPPIVLAGNDGAALDPPPDTGADLRWITRDMQWVAGASTSLLVARDGARIALDGTRPRVVNVDPAVVATRDGLMGVDRSVAAPSTGAPRGPMADEKRWASAPQGTRPVRDRAPRAR